MSNEPVTDRREIRRLTDQISRFKLLVSAFVVLALYGLLTFYFPLPESANQGPPRAWPFLIEPKGGWLEIRTALGGAMISFAAFGVILEILRFKSMHQEVEEAMGQAFSNSVPLIAGLNNAKKRDFVRNSLEALLGKGIGESTYKYVEPMLEDGAGFRTNYEYNVFIMDDPRKSIPDYVVEQFPSDRYRWVVEDLSYKLLKPTRSKPSISEKILKAVKEDYDNGPFKILFLFDKTSLELLNPKEEFFGRFLIELDESELNWVLDLKPDEAETFFRDTFQPVLLERTDDGKEITLDFSVKRVGPLEDIKNRCKPYFEVKTHKAPMSNGSLTSSDGASKLKLGFTYPYRKSATHFIFTLPQPVYAPFLSLDYSLSDIQNVDYGSYLSCADPKKAHVHPPEEHKKCYRVDVSKSWVFPRSGVTFVWQNLE